MIRRALAAIVLGLLALPANADEFRTTYEAPGVERPSPVVTGNASVIGIETFDGLLAGETAFATDYGTGGKIVGDYSQGVTILPADEFGGAGGIGQYVAAMRETPGFRIAFQTKDIPGINYFGFWLSALDKANRLTFYRNGSRIGEYDPQTMIAALGECPSPPWMRDRLVPAQPSRYCGNPHSPYDPGELFAFVNFVDRDGYFDEIRFEEAPDYPGNFESDNHTVAYCAKPDECISGIQVALAIFARRGRRLP